MRIIMKLLLLVFLGWGFENKLCILCGKVFFPMMVDWGLKIINLLDRFFTVCKLTSGFYGDVKEVIYRCSISISESLKGLVSCSQIFGWDM